MIVSFHMQGIDGSYFVFDSTESFETPHTPRRRSSSISSAIKHSKSKSKLYDLLTHVIWLSPYRDKGCRGKWIFSRLSSNCSAKRLLQVSNRHQRECLKRSERAKSSEWRKSVEDSMYMYEHGFPVGIVFLEDWIFCYFFRWCAVTDTRTRKSFLERVKLNVAQVITHSELVNAQLMVSSVIEAFHWLGRDGIWGGFCTL